MTVLFSVAVLSYCFVFCLYLCVNDIGLLIQDLGTVLYNVLKNGSNFWSAFMLIFYQSIENNFLAPDWVLPCKSSLQISENIP